MSVRTWWKARHAQREIRRHEREFERRWLRLPPQEQLKIFIGILSQDKALARALRDAIGVAHVQGFRKPPSSAAVRQ